MFFDKSKFEEGLREEFDCWLENREWTEEELKEIDKLTEEEKDDIVGYVLNDDELTQAMFSSFQWFLNLKIGGRI